MIGDKEKTLLKLRYFAGIVAIILVKMWVKQKEEAKKPLREAKGINLSS